MKYDDEIPSRRGVRAFAPTRRIAAKKGFTLIELLIVMGIIMILAGLLYVGIKKISNHTREKAVRADLLNCMSMLAEFETKATLSTPPTSWYWAGAAYPTTPPPPAGVDFWHVPNNTVRDQPIPAPLRPTGAFPTGQTVFANDKIDVMGDAIRNTGIAFLQLARTPVNKKLMQNMTADKNAFAEAWVSSQAYSPGARVYSGTPIKFYRCTQAVASGGSAPTASSSWIEDASTMLDPWGNPMIYVPATGMSGVYVGGVSTPYIVTSAGTISESDYIAGTTKLPASRRPFFASAGPDGIFGYFDKNENGAFDANIDVPGGDDNVYSFQN